MTVLITLTTAGADSGPFDLYSNLDGYVSAFATGVSKSALLAGYSSSAVPNGTTTIRIKSTGVCTNYIDVTVVTTTTTTTTGSPTTTTTTSAAPIGDTFFIVNSSASASSTIDNITVSSASFYTLTTGSLPVGFGQTASGTHSAIASSNIDVDVTYPIGGGCLTLYVNSVVVSSVGVSGTGTFSFIGVTFGTTDIVEIELIDGSCS